MPNERITSDTKLVIIDTIAISNSPDPFTKLRSRHTLTNNFLFGHFPSTNYSEPKIPRSAKMRYILQMAIPEKFTKPYNAKDVEPAIYGKWEDSGYFNPDKLPG